MSDDDVDDESASCQRVKGTWDDDDGLLGCVTLKTVLGTEGFVGEHLVMVGCCLRLFVTDLSKSVVRPSLNQGQGAGCRKSVGAVCGSCCVSE